MRRCRRGMAASFADGSAGAQGVVSSRSAVGGHRICGRPKFEPPSCSCARHRRRGGEGARGCSVAVVTFLLTLAVATSEPTGVRDHVYSPGTLHPTLRATLPPWSKGRGGIAQGAELLRAKRLNRPPAIESLGGGAAPLSSYRARALPLRLPASQPQSRASIQSPRGAEGMRPTRYTFRRYLLTPCLPLPFTFLSPVTHPRKSEL